MTCVSISDELKEALTRQGFQNFLKLSSGSYATVYKSYLKTGKKSVPRAIKVVESAPEKMIEEVKLMEKFDHKNIIEYYGKAMSSTQYGIILEFAIFGTIKDFMDKFPDEMDIQRSLLWITDVVNGLAYMHSLMIAHRDIKCENCLLVKGGRTLKLADFGLSRQFSLEEDGIPLCQEYMTTDLYAPPEILMEEPHDALKHDSWSSGILLFFMLNGKLPYTYSSNPLEMIPCQQAKSCLPSFIGNDLTHWLLKRFLDPNRNERISIQEAKLKIAEEINKKRKDPEDSPILAMILPKASKVASKEKINEKDSEENKGEIGEVP